MTNDPGFSVEATYDRLKDNFSQLVKGKALTVPQAHILMADIVTLRISASA